MDSAFGVPSAKKSGPRIFSNPSTSAGPDQFFDIPRWANFVHIFAIGPGAGGGGGHTAAAGAQRGGGAGGGAGAHLKLYLPAFLLPSRIYIQVGKGGLGGTATNPGGAPISTTTISVEQSVNVGDLLCNSVAAAGGTQGTAAAGGSLGAVGTFTLAQGGLGSALGVGTAGLALSATNGNATTTAGNVTILTGGNFTNGGAGGAGVTTGNVTGNGGSIVGSSSFTPTLPAGGAGGAAGGGAGGDGIVLMQPMFTCGGAGGGSSGTSGVGGKGGKGGVGCGGGGGGGGVTGGAGGDGGDGLVMIWVF